MTDSQILKIAIYLTKKCPGDVVQMTELGNLIGISVATQHFPLSAVCKTMHKNGSRLSVQIGKKNTLRIYEEKNISPKKIKKQATITIAAKPIKEPVKIKIKPRWTGPKTGSEAAGKYLAHQLFGYTEKSCTTTMAFNQLKMNGFTNFDFQQALKYANSILKNEYKLKLELINGYLFPKKIEDTKKVKLALSSLKKIEPLIQINGQKQDFKGFKLFVYDSINNLVCTNGQHHKTENVTMITNNCLNKQVRFNVFHCLNCNKYYTTSQTVKKEFPLIHYPFVPLQFTNINELQLNEQSELKIYGYNAQKNGLSEYERKNLLLSLLHYEILTKHKIIQILQFNINFHQSNPIFSEAISKWEDDLEFVQNYGLEKQKTIVVNNVDVMYKGKKQK